MTTIVSKDDKSRIKPGRVLPKGSIQLHTQIAHSLFYGDKSQGHKPCFLLYASQLNTLWDLALADDPYADQALIEIENQIKVVRDSLINELSRLERMHDSLRRVGIELDPCTADSPVRVEPAFRAVHAAASAELLGMTDLAVRKALALKHFGRCDEKDWQQFRKLTVAKVRQLFAMSRYRASGVTRKDMYEKNQVRWGRAEIRMQDE